MSHSIETSNLKSFFEDFHTGLTHVGVNGRQWVVEEVDVSVAVDGPGQADSLLLPAGQVDSLLADFCQI